MGLRGRDQNRIFLDVGGESSSDGYQRVEEGSGGGGGENEHMGLLALEVLKVHHFCA